MNLIDFTLMGIFLDFIWVSISQLIPNNSLSILFHNHENYLTYLRFIDF
jgi:hypothetical protein